jgi:hypothetical protein
MPPGKAITDPLQPAPFHFRWINLPASQFQAVPATIERPLAWVTSLRNDDPPNLQRLSEQLSEQLQGLSRSVLTAGGEQSKKLTEAILGTSERMKSLTESILGQLRIPDPLAGLVEQLTRQNSEIHGWFVKFDRNLRESESDVRLLAQCGWTFPMWASLNLAVELMNETDRNAPNTSEIDSAFEERYARQDGAQFDEIASELLSSAVLAPWRSLLIECLSSYRRGEFNIPVPALFTILEGAAISIAGTPRAKEPSRPMAAAAGAASDTMDMIIRVSLYEFLLVLFANSDFTKDEPARTNRHWVLHGRSRRPFTRLDCIRLFHALHTLSYGTI